jgi:Transglutaminase-like superfamily
MELPPGLLGVRETLKVMRRLVLAAKDSDFIRRNAAAIASATPEKDKLAIIAALFDYVQNEIHYFKDPTGAERVDTPREVFLQGFGDCDDKAAALAASLESLGFHTRFVAMGFKPAALTHVALDVLLGDDWRRDPVLHLDASEPQPMGWRAPGAFRVLMIYNDEDEHAGELGPELGLVPTWEAGATQALNLIPGVGPPLAAIASVAESIFQSGGDPTPEWQLETTVMQTREQIALLHRQMGTPDAFPIPLPDAKSADHLTVLRAAVTEALGHPGSGPTWRNDLYTSIKNLQGELADLQGTAHDTQLLTEFEAMQRAQAPQTSLPTPTPPPEPSVAASGGSNAPRSLAPLDTGSAASGAIDPGPWILAAAGAIALLISAR